MGFLQRIFDSFGAAAFAEAGDHNGAREYLAEAGLLDKEPRGLSVWDKTMAAAAFAEAGEFEMAREFLRQEDPPKGVKVQSEFGLAQIHDRLTEAITFAESGFPEHALSLIKQGQRPAVVVLCEEAHFSQDLMECAFRMAKGKGLDILIVSLFAATSASEAKISEDVRKALINRAEEKLAPWFEEARSREIRLGHLVSFLDAPKTLQKIRQEFRIRYVISLPEEELYLREVHIFSF
ncbi:hypothetical protein [Thermosulfuriphilus sp.]